MPAPCLWAIPASCCATAPTCARPNAAWPAPPPGSGWPRPTCSRGISIRGFAGFLSGDFSALVAGRNEAWSVAPSIGWAAFDLGSVRARLRAAEAGADGAAIQYEQAVLLALEDAENSLQGYARRQERLAIVIAQAQAATEAERLAAVGYREGASDFLVLLDAQRNQLAADDALAEAEAAVNIAAVAVYKALGGAGTGTGGGIAAAELPARR